MGKNAKLKRLRKQLENQSNPTQSFLPTDSNPTKFVEHFEQQGFQLHEGKRSPEILDHRVEPKL